MDRVPFKAQISNCIIGPVSRLIQKAKGHWDYMAELSSKTKSRNIPDFYLVKKSYVESENICVLLIVGPDWLSMGGRGGPSKSNTCIIASWRVWPGLINWVIINFGLGVPLARKWLRGQGLWNYYLRRDFECVDFVQWWN